MAKRATAQAKRADRTYLTEVEAKQLLQSAGIPVVVSSLARTKKEALALSQQSGFPVVLKVASPDILHKSDCGGVRVGLTSARQVGEAYHDIMAAVKEKTPKARVYGVSVQKMAPPGIEVIIGMTRDVQFGPVLMFGIGGTLVELLKDVSFRIVPVTLWDAAQMVREIKGFPLLQGYRGQPPVDLPALERLIAQVSQFVERHPEIDQLDLNPVFVYPDGAVAADARIVLKAP